MKKFIKNTHTTRSLHAALLLTVSLAFGAPQESRAAQITIISPRGGFTTNRIQEIKGTITGFSGNRARMIINGIPQTIPLQNGSFQLNAVVAPGNNVVEITAGGASQRVSFYARVPKRDMKVVLTWDTRTDVDLWVIDPKGEKCYYSHPSTKSGGNLDVDITTGFGPETFTMSRAMPGNYSIQVQYYSAYNIPVTRVNLYIIVYEGTPREYRRHYTFVMTRPEQVYHITDFNLEEEQK